MKYTLCLIRHGNKILLLNRERSSWMGCWNGIGGKIEEGEKPRTSMLREIDEETGITELEISFKGVITWSTVEGTSFGGMYLYLADLPEDYVYQTPIKTAEGILDWKEFEWILDSENLGIASNIPPCLEKVLNDSNCYHYHSIFQDHSMIDQVSTSVDSRVEMDEVFRNLYLKKYIEEFTNGKLISSK